MVARQGAQLLLGFQEHLMFEPRGVMVMTSGAPRTDARGGQALIRSSPRIKPWPLGFVAEGPFHSKTASTLAGAPPPRRHSRQCC